MSEPLTNDDINLILNSLDYTRRAFEQYTYPTNELKQSQIQHVDSVKEKVRALRANLRKSNDVSDEKGKHS